MTEDRSIPLEHLAEGHCLALQNAFRLIEDGEALIDGKRYLSAINLFRLAAEELAKAHMITNAVVFNEEKQWDWFWSHFADHREKSRILEYEIHWKFYQDKDEFHRRVAERKQSREGTLYVNLDQKTKKFSLPGSQLIDQEKTARAEYQYVRGLFLLFAPVGIPTVDIMIESYKNIRQRYDLQKKATFYQSGLTKRSSRRRSRRAAAELGLLALENLRVRRWKRKNTFTGRMKTCGSGIWKNIRIIGRREKLSKNYKII